MRHGCNNAHGAILPESTFHILSLFCLSALLYGHFLWLYAVHTVAGCIISDTKLSGVCLFGGEHAEDPLRRNPTHLKVDQRWATCCLSFGALQDISLCASRPRKYCKMRHLFLAKADPACANLVVQALRPIQSEPLLCMNGCATHSSRRVMM